MINVADFAKRIRRRRTIAFIAFFGCALMLTLNLVSRLPPAVRLEASIPWVFGMIIGLVFYYLSLELPKKEILQLAQARNGLLTVSEIATALAIDPDLALNTLRHLQRIGVASPRWEELQRNLWEFPDYVKLPIAETIDLARARGGRVSMRDLLAQGHTPDIARQTIDALSDKGLAQPDTASADTVVLAASA